MSADDSNLLNDLADEFLSRRHAGEAPSLSEYCRRHPELEAEIRELFPTLALLEELKPQDDGGDLPIPDRIGGYRILSVIGQGGMGLVYEAEHESLGRRVALKVIAQQLTQDQRARARFLLEARAIANLHHTNIVPLFEVGEDQGRLFLVMQLIPGKSLDKVIASLRCVADEDSESRHALLPGSVEVPPVSPDSGTQTSSSTDATGSLRRRRHYAALARIGLQAAEALAYAHRRGIVHRDVKPSNFLMDENGVVWLTDFGLAKTDEDELTRSEDVLGTLRYMAPERFRGECDERSDIYALGLTLYELIATRPAFPAADRLVLMESIRGGDPPSLRAHARNTPRDLDIIVLKACANEPKRRYSSAKDFADDLRRFLADEPILARRISLIERVARWSRRNRALAAASLLVCVLTVALSVGSIIAAYWFQRQATIERGLARKAASAELRAQESLELAEARGDKLQRSLYVAEMTRAAQVSTLPGGIKQVFSITESWRPERAGAELRGWEWYCLRSLCNQESVVMDGHPGRSWTVSWSPDGTRIASSGADGVKLWDAASGDRVGELPINDFAESVAYSPDGRFIASAIHHSPLIVVHNAITQEVLASLHCGKHWPLHLCWHQDSQRLVAGTNWGGLLCWNVSENRVLTTYAADQESAITSVDWHPSGDHLLAGDRIGKVHIWNIDSPTVAYSIDAHAPGPVYEVRASSRGDRLVSTGEDAVTRLWDWNSRQLIDEITGIGIVYTVEWSANDSHLAMGGAGHDLTIWDSQTLQKTRSLLGHESVVWKLQWDPEGDRIASVDPDVGKVRIWDLTDPAPTYVQATASASRTIAWDVDDEGLLLGCYDGSVHQWQPAAQTLEQVLGQSRRRVGHVAVSPDGKRLAVWGFSRKLNIWDRDSSELLRSFDVPPLGGALAWTQNHDLLAAFNTDRFDVRTFSVSNGESKLSFADVTAATKAAAFSAQNQLATAHNDGQIRVWDLATREQVGQMETDHEDQGNVRILAWNPGATHVAASFRSIISVWNVASGHKAFDLDGHTSLIRAVCWSPDGARLASGSRDNTVRIWDAHTGRELLAFETLGEVNAVCFSRDGKRLAAACADHSEKGLLYLWDASRAYGWEHMDSTSAKPARSDSEIATN